MNPTPLAFESFSVAILAGGHSRRMGVDKAHIRLEPNGPTMIERALGIAKALSGDVMVIGREAQDQRDSAAKHVPDFQSGLGPLAGIATALEASRYDRCLVIPCDAPFLSLPVLEWMASMEMWGDALIPVTIDESRQGDRLTYQTLHAIYRPSSLGAIHEAIAQGSRRTTDWHRAAQIQILAEDDIRKLDPDLLTFFTVNSPADLAKAELIAARRSRTAGVGTPNRQPL